ncbi:MAG: 4Fe-4S dicluster domain-containing protein [Candidatus Binatia bacterium]
MADLPLIPWEHLPKRTQRSLEKKRAGMVVDLQRCVGCHACSVACKTEHQVPLGGFRTRVRYLQRPDRPTLAFLPLLCMHCQDAPCMDACPTGAVIRLQDGRVIIDQEKCCGNKACIAACPYGAIYIDPQTHLADKCDLCTNRTSLGMDPACVTACPVDALRFGDLDDPADPVTRYARQGGAQPFKEDAGTRPSVVYIGLEDWMERKAATGVQLAPEDEDIIYEQG